MEEENKVDDYANFIKDSLRQLKTTRVCYVYTKEQLNEILKKYDKDTYVEENGCGYTIWAIKERKKRNE